jgi:hypothetical protein
MLMKPIPAELFERDAFFRVVERDHTDTLCVECWVAVFDGHVVIGKLVVVASFKVSVLSLAVLLQIPNPLYITVVPLQVPTVKLCELHHLLSALNKTVNMTHPLSHGSAPKVACAYNRYSAAHGGKMSGRAGFRLRSDLMGFTTTEPTPIIGALLASERHMSVILLSSAAVQAPRYSEGFTRLPARRVCVTLPP